MIRALTCSADAYVAQRWIDSRLTEDGNVGAAGTIDVYKIRGASFTVTSGSRVPNVELTRGLVRFDSAWLSAAVATGAVNYQHESFSATLRLNDAYGGQTVPRDLTISVHPLSRSFREGEGRDIVFLADSDACNFVSASRTELWGTAGCAQAGAIGTQCDYFSDDDGLSLEQRCFLPDGTEDLRADVTRSIKLHCAGAVPRAAFRVALSASLESDSNSYFVKRFSSRHAHDSSKRPAVWVGWDDSLVDNTLSPKLDERVTLVFESLVDAARTPVLRSDGTAATGSDCMLLKLASGSSWTSTHSAGQVWLPAAGYAHGLYSASFSLSSSVSTIATSLASSGSFLAQPIWLLADGTLVASGSALRFRRRLDPEPRIERLGASIAVGSTWRVTDVIRARASTHDPGAQLAERAKRPRVAPNVLVRNLHFVVVDALSGVEIVSPDTRGSTKCSADAVGHHWSIHASVLAGFGPCAFELRVQLPDGTFLPFGERSAPFTVIE